MTDHGNPIEDVGDERAHRLLRAFTSETLRRMARILALAGGAEPDRLARRMPHAQGLGGLVRRGRAVPAPAFAFSLLLTQHPYFLC